MLLSKHSENDCNFGTTSKRCTSYSEGHCTVKFEFVIKTNNYGLGRGSVRKSSCWVWGTVYGRSAATKAAGHGCNTSVASASLETVSSNFSKRQRTPNTSSSGFCICELVCTPVLSCIHPHTQINKMMTGIKYTHELETGDTQRGL